MRLAAVLDRHAARLDVEALAVLAPRERLELDVLAGERTGMQRTHALVQGIRAHGETVAPDRFLARAAAHRLVGGVDVDHAELGVAQHQRIGGGIEHGAVLLGRAGERLLVRAALELGLGAHREDLQHRLDDRVVDQGLLRQDGEHTHRAAGRVVEGIAGVAHGAEVGQQLVVRITGDDAVRHEHERLADYLAARRGRNRVLEVLQIAVDAVDPERPDALAIHRADERQLAMEDRGQVARQLGEDALAARARNRERRVLQGCQPLLPVHGASLGPGGG